MSLIELKEKLDKQAQQSVKLKGSDLIDSLKEISYINKLIENQTNGSSSIQPAEKYTYYGTSFLIIYSDLKDLEKSLHIHKIIKAIKKLVIRYILPLDNYVRIYDKQQWTFYLLQRQCMTTQHR